MAYVQFVIDNPELFTIMFSGQVQADDQASTEAVSRSFRRLQTILGEAAEAGELVDEPRLVSVAAWSLVHGLAALWLSGRFRGRGNAAAERKALIQAVSALCGRRVRPALPSSVPSSVPPRAALAAPSI